MIFDTLAHASHYDKLSPRFAKAFAHIAQLDAHTPDGRIEVEGDDLFILVQSYDTKPSHEKKFESHRKYADVQVVLAGDEEMHCAPVDMLTPEGVFDEERDFQLYLAFERSSVLRARPGTFIIFLPQDGHMPGCASPAGAMRVKKLVAKVRV
jgi:YhcH/YjgK/YiaL family protein